MSSDRITIVGQVYAVPPVIASGKAIPAMTDAAELIVAGPGGGGAIVVEFEPPSSYDSIGPGALASAGVITAGPATLLDLNVYNASTALRYVQLFDAGAVPVDGTPPATIPIAVPGLSHGYLSFANGQGRDFAAGISWANSSTLLLKSLAGPELIINAQFR